MAYFLLMTPVVLISYNLLPNSMCGALLSIIGCIFLIKSKIELRVNKYIFFSILILNIISIISFISCKNINLFFDGFFVYLTVLIFYLIFINFNSMKLSNAFVYITSVSAGIFVIFQGLIQTARVDGNFSYANTYGLVLLICLYVNEIKEKDNFYPIIQWILILGILFTESRNTFIYLIIFVILCFTIDLKQKREFKTIINFFTAIIIYILVKNLGSAITLTIPIFYIIFYYVYKKLYLNSRKHLSMIFIISLVTLILIILFIKTGFNTRISNITLGTGSLQERFVYYEDALKCIWKNPLGLGINSFVYNQYKHQSAFYDVKYIHNSLLQVCYDLGIIGLLVFIFIFVYGLYLIFKFENDRIKRVLKTALLSSIYLHSLLDFDFSFPTIFILVIMIINFSCKVYDLEIKKCFKLMLLCLSILISVYICIINVFSLMGDNYAKKDLNKSLYLYELNRNITFNNPDIYVFIAQVYNKNNLLKKCLDNLKIAEQINPEDPRIKTNLAFTYEKLDDINNTIKYYDKVLEYEKYYPEIYKKYYLYLGGIYNKTNDPKYVIKMDNLKKIYYKNFNSLNKRTIFLKNQLSNNFDSIIDKNEQVP